MLGMRAQAPFGQGCPKVHRGRASWAALFHPSALPRRIHLVGRVANDNGDRLIPLDRVRLFPRIADGGQHGGKSRLFGIGVAQGIGHIKARLRQVAPCPGARCGSPHQGPHFRHQPQLCHGKRAKLQFEPDQPMRRRPQGGTNSARALIVGHRLGDLRSTPRRKVPVPVAGSAWWHPWRQGVHGGRTGPGRAAPRPSGGPWPAPPRRVYNCRSRQGVVVDL